MRQPLPLTRAVLGVLVFCSAFLVTSHLLPFGSVVGPLLWLLCAWWAVRALWWRVRS